MSGVVETATKTVFVLFFASRAAPAGQGHKRAQSSARFSKIARDGCTGPGGVFKLDSRLASTPPTPMGVSVSTHKLGCSLNSLTCAPPRQERSLSGFRSALCTVCSKFGSSLVLLARRCCRRFIRWMIPVTRQPQARKPVTHSFSATCTQTET